MTGSEPESQWPSVEVPGAEKEESKTPTAAPAGQQPPPPGGQPEPGPGSSTRPGDSDTGPFVQPPAGRDPLRGPGYSPYAASSPPVPPPEPAGSLSDWDLDFDLPPAAPAPAAPASPASPAAPQATAPPPVAPPTGAPGSLILEVTVGQRTTEVPLTADEVLIGRLDPSRGVSPTVDLSQDDAVSRRHARIVHRGDAFFLADLGSTNGTKLNSRWLDPNREERISPGDRIELGALTTICVLEAPA